MRLKPQLTQDVSIENTATIVVAPRALPGTRASAAMATATGRDDASTYPVTMMSAICIVNGTSSQNPFPQLSTTATGVAPAAATPSTTTRIVAARAKTN